MNYSNNRTYGLIETYDHGNISSWASSSDTYKLSYEDNNLKINYIRSGNGQQRWHTFVFDPSKEIDISKKPVISISIKSSVNITLSIKPHPLINNLPPLSHSVTGDNIWRTIYFNLNPKIIKQIKKIFFYIDAGLTVKKQGVVWIKEITLGDAVPTAIYPDWRELDNALNSVRALLKNSVEGLEDSQFKSGSKTILESFYFKMIAFRESQSKSQEQIDKALRETYDACVSFETSVNRTKTTLNDTQATKETCYLYLNLQHLKTKALLFGMQNSTGKGVDWSGDDDRSDIKDICGDYPAVFGEDLVLVEFDNHPERLRYRLTQAYNSGSIITLSWHQYDPELRGYYSRDVRREKIIPRILPGGQDHEEYKDKLYRIAGFLKSLRSKNGESIPVIFRPFHEHSSRSFWWGAGSCSPGEFIQIWQFTQNYLRNTLNVHNLIYAISPILQQVDSKENYFERYPGDDYVDIFGADFYFKWYYPTFYSFRKFKKGLQTLVRHSSSRNKIAALTEVGSMNLKLKDWFTKVLDILKNDPLASNVAYMLLWHNTNSNHHFAPYPGHQSTSEFLNFYNDPYTFFQHDLPYMYANPDNQDDTPG